MVVFRIPTINLTKNIQRLKRDCQLQTECSWTIAGAGLCRQQDCPGLAVSWLQEMHHHFERTGGGALFIVTPGTSQSTETIHLN
jgi:hypothetical protein